MYDTETIWSQTLELLREHGWKWELGSPGLCISEALSVCVHDPLLIPAVREKLNQHLGIEIASPGASLRSLVFWNDDPDRAFADVEQALTELHEQELAEGELTRA